MVEAEIIKKEAEKKAKEVAEAKEVHEKKLKLEAAERDLKHHAEIYRLNPTGANRIDAEYAAKNLKKELE